MKPFFIYLLLSMSIFSFGQDLPDLTTYSKDIGFNTSILLSGILSSYASPFDIMLKQQKTSNTAIRYGCKLFVDVNTNTYQSSNSYYQNENYFISISVGKERQAQLTKKWIFYYGGDLAPFYESYKQSNYETGQLRYENLNSEIGLRVSPFLGLRFQINSRLYVATEALLRLSYGRKEASWKSYDNFNNVGNQTSQGFNNVKLQALPATGIFVFYRF